MNPLVQRALGSILRAILLGWAGHLVKPGIWTAADAETYAEAGALAILALGWSLWQKYQQHLTVLAALDAPAGTSLARLTWLRRRPWIS